MSVSVIVSTRIFTAYVAFAQLLLSSMQVYDSTICFNSYLCGVAQTRSVREVGICYFAVICCSTCAAFVRIEVQAKQPLVTFPWFAVQCHSYLNVLSLNMNVDNFCCKKQRFTSSFVS
jgi:hypothetical protein